jgi:hypothetical protein
VVAGAAVSFQTGSQHGNTGTKDFHLFPDVAISVEAVSKLDTKRPIPA